MCKGIPGFHIITISMIVFVSTLVSSCPKINSTESSHKSPAMTSNTMNLSNSSIDLVAVWLATPSKLEFTVLEFKASGDYSYKAWLGSMSDEGDGKYLIKDKKLYMSLFDSDLSSAEGPGVQFKLNGDVLEFNEDAGFGSSKFQRLPNGRTLEQVYYEQMELLRGDFTLPKL